MSEARVTISSGKEQSLLLECALAVVLVALATGLRMLLQPAMGLSVPYVTFFLSNALVIRFTGPAASILAILLSTFSADWFFLAPEHTLWSSPAQYFTSGLFITANVVIMALAHAMRTAKEQAEQEKAILQVVIDGAMNSHLAYLDRDFNFVRVNETYAKTCGYKPQEMVGKNHFALYPHPENEAIFACVRDTGVAAEFHDKPFEFPDQPERGVTYWDWTLTPVKDTGRNVTGLVLSLFDTTERKRMAEELNQAKDDLHRHAEDLETTVKERTARLQEVIGDLEHFSYTLSHDMRAPLRTMVGFSQLMMEGGCSACPNPDSKDLLQRIIAGGRRMDALLSDALTYSRAVHSELKLKPVDVGRLLQIVRETHPNLQPEFADIQLKGDFPKVLGNETALTQCFANLLDNAVKFVDQGVQPTIRIWSEAQGTHLVRFWVQDNGIGIRKEDQPKLFGMFQRMTRNYEGTGIGLALVRKNVERMGGQVGVESEPGKGSRFWIQLKQATKVA